jgi:hypothetical protein
MNIPGAITFAITISCAVGYEGQFLGHIGQVLYPPLSGQRAAQLYGPDASFTGPPYHGRGPILHHLWGMTRSVLTLDTSRVFVTHIFVPYAFYATPLKTGNCVSFLP